MLSKKLKIKIYRTIILPVFLYGCETWSLTLRNERRLRMFENRVPLGRPRLRWKDNIKLDLQEVECTSMDWIELAKDRYMWRALVNAAMNLWVP